uniref:Protein FAM48A n=1 Tax=Lygus hesperus TaxID=30085 RepID=A0A146LSS6_LYGHE
MQSLQLANDELSNNVEFDFNEVTGIEEVEVVEICDGVNEFDWRIDTPEASIEPPLDEDLEHHNPNQKEQNQEPHSSANSSSILRRLQHVHNKEPHCPQTFPFLNSGQSSNLLEKLVLKNQLNMVTVTLYPGEKPYSLRLVASGGKLIQESDQPVTQDSLLEYIDKQELPPFLAEEWDQVFPQLFYNGCVIVSLRDLRLSNAPALRCTILKPHTQSIISDVNTIVSSKSGYTNRERASVESYLFNSVQGDLCLDPSLKTGIRRLNHHFCDYALHSSPLSKSIARNEQRLKRKRKVQYSSMPLLDFLSKKRVKEKRSKEPVEEKLVNKKVGHSSHCAVPAGPSTAFTITSLAPRPVGTMWAFKLAKPGPADEVSGSSAASQTFLIKEEASIEAPMPIKGVDYHSSSQISVNIIQDVSVSTHPLSSTANGVAIKKKEKKKKKKHVYEEITAKV